MIERTLGQFGFAAIAGQDLNDPHVSIARTLPLLPRNRPNRSEQLFFGSARGADELLDNIATKFNHNFICSQIDAGALKKLIERHVRRALRNSDDPTERIVAEAVLVFGVLDYIRGVVQAFEDKPSSRERWQIVQNLHCFLYLNAGNDGGDRGCRGNFSLSVRFLQEK